jgi:NADH:ubiquinone oxidoreductase subunit E
MEAKEVIFQGLELKQKDLIHLLHRVQAQYGYIPVDIVEEIAQRLRISAAEVFGVLTFYKAFALEPRGQHTVTICLGTACHVRGGKQIVEEAERRLNIRAGQTTPDRKFSLETVNCLGCCAIGPVVVVDGVYHSHVTIDQVEKILKETSSAEEGQ